MAELTRLGAMLETGVPWAEPMRLCGVRVIQRMAERLLGRLTKRKWANAGAGARSRSGRRIQCSLPQQSLDGGMYHLYRERFLLRTHGAGWA